MFDLKWVHLFPHPYVGHKNIEEIANNSDLIEVFNSRVSDEKNKKSLELANKYSKKHISRLMPITKIV